MYTVTRTCKVLPKVITKVRRAATLVDLQDNMSSRWGWLRPDGYRHRLCTSQEEDKHVAYSGNTLAQTKKEQCWRYDPTVKYEAFRRHAVPRYAYDSSDWSDFSDAETENVFMAGKEAQTEKHKILAGTKEEQLFRHDPSIEYESLKRYVVPRFAFSDTSSTDWSDSSDSESETMAEATQTQEDEILAGTRVEQLFRYDSAKSPSTNLRSKSTAPDLPFLVKHGAKNPAEGGAKDSKRAKEMDLYTGVENLTNNDQNKGGEFDRGLRGV